MAISSDQKLDYLWKKLGYGAAKTDTNAIKKAPNEAISSPLLIRGDKVWQQAVNIPGVIPTANSSIVTVYTTSAPIECTEDATATADRTWKTGLTDWIPPEIGSTYQVKIYIHTSGDSAGASGGTQVFATGSGNDDEWFFDYQSGVLHFIGTNLPNGVSFTGKSVYVSGARYTGYFGVGTTSGEIANIGNLIINDVTISTIDANANLILSPGGSIVDVDGSYLINLADPVDAQDAVTLSYLNSAISSASPTMSADDTSIIIHDDGIDPGWVEITVDGTVVANINDTSTTLHDLSFEGGTISSTTGNLVLDAAGSGIVQFAGSEAIWLPHGGDGTRPTNPEEGYTRYNTERESIEVWTGNVWYSPGIDTLVTSDSITPDGLANTFTLGTNATTDGVLVSINGTLQQPFTAYTVSNNSITFTETPLTTDIIEVRHLSVGAVTVGSLSYGSDTSVSLDSNNINVKGNVVPTANVTYDLGTNSLRWRDLYLSGNTITMGNLTLSDDGGILSVLDSSGSPAPLTAADPVADTDVVTLGYLNTELSGLSSGSLIADDTEIAINDDGIDPGNVEVIVDGTNVVTFTDTTVTFYANVVAQNISDEINDANVNMQGYVDDAITTVGTDITNANVNMQGYVDLGLENVDSAITTANVNMQGYVDNEISNLINSAPATLDTLNELAAALGNDANLSTTLTTMISNVESNVSTLQSTVSSLESNAAVQSGLIDDNASAITTANVNLKGYVDNEITTVGTTISTANVNMKGYVDTQLATKVSTNDNPTFSGASLNGDVFIGGDLAVMGPSGLTVNDDIYMAGTSLSAYGATLYINNINASGLLSTRGITEVLNTKTGATGTVTHDYSEGSIWYHSSISADFTANFTNVPTDNNQAVSVVLLLSQGGTAYLPTALQVNSSSVTIKWADASTPIGSANQIDVVSFTLIRLSSSWTAIATLSTFG